jgi:AcrR family transcriptional regulator
MDTTLARPFVLVLIHDVERPSRKPMKSTKERILAQGLNLLTSTGFANVTVGVLAQRSGMSKSGLFAHFGSKEDVQLELLEETLRVGTATFIEPALRHPPGLERLRAVVHGWFGWTEKAGLEGGCPIAAGLFEYDDAPVEAPVRQRLVAMEERWRMFLGTMASEAVEAGELRADLDVEQFVWELHGLYLNHHVSQRFLHDPNANARAQEAFEGLIKRSLSEKRKAVHKKRKDLKPDQPAKEAR